MKKQTTLVTLDFETYYGTKYSLKNMTYLDYYKSPEFKIHGVGVKINADSACYLTDAQDIKDYLDRLRDEHEHITLVCHNTMFDGLILYYEYGFTPDQYACTQAMSRGLWPILSASLDALAKRLWANDDSKRKGEELQDFFNVRELDAAQKETLARYCINDVELTYDAYIKMLDLLPADEMQLIHIIMRNYVEPIMVLDVERVKKHTDKITDETNLLVEKSGYKKTQLSSNPQFAQILTDLKVEVPMKTSLTTGKQTYAFGKSDLPYQELKREQPGLGHIFRAREAVKSTIETSRSKRLLTMAGHTGGLLHVPIKYAAAHTHRFGGTEKINMQNFSRGSELRLSLTAPEGSLVAVADSSNIEARVLAWMANQTDLLKVFERGDDVYSHTAEHCIYHRPINKEKNPLERFIGKVTTLGLGYQMGVNKFMDLMHSGPFGADPIFIDKQTAKDIVYGYRSKNYAISGLWGEAQHALLDMMHVQCDRMLGPVRLVHNAAILPNGLVIHYKNLRMEQGSYVYDGRYGPSNIYGGKFVENLVQALARIVICHQMLKVDNYLTSNGYGRVVLQVHDEIVSIVKKEHIDEVMDYKYKAMREKPEWAEHIPLDVEGGYDYCYSK